MTSTAVLGAGTMGAAMTRSLARSDLPVSVWNRTPARSEALAGDGVGAAASVADAVRGADVIITMLFDADAVLEVADEVLANASPDAVWLQCATIGGDGIRTLVDRVDGRLALVDAPVLGTKQPAENGKLVVLASGPRAAVDRAEPVLAAIGSRTQYLGEEPGHATALKLACNAWLASLTAAAAQSLALTEALGVEPQQFLEAIRGGTQDAPYLQRKGAQMIAGDYPPAFSLAAAAKDVELVQSACEAAGVPSGLVEAIGDSISRSIELGHGNDDIAAIRAGFDRS